MEYKYIIRDYPARVQLYDNIIESLKSQNRESIREPQDIL